MDNQVLEVIRKRSSARAYSDEEITKEQLEKIIEAGLQGPTGMNKKEIHFTVVKGDAPILEELDAEKRALRGQDKSYFDKALAIPEGYSFQIALAVGHKTDNKTPHDYDESVQVSYL